MSRLTINDEIVEAGSGENLLGLARRHGSHIWFLCDGRGLCRTCEFRVLSGGEHLSPPSAIERESLSESRRAEGYRLACQAAVKGPGDVTILSTVEHLRRQAIRLDLPDLFAELTRFSVDFSNGLTGSATEAIPRLISTPPSLPGVERYVRDGLRMIARLL